MKVGQPITIVMGNIFRKSCAWFGGLGTGKTHSINFKDSDVMMSISTRVYLLTRQSFGYETGSTNILSIAIILGNVLWYLEGRISNLGSF